MSKRELNQQLMLQKLLLKDAEQRLNLDKMLSTPTVVIDLGATEFWTTLINSPRKDEGLKQIRDGSLIPINADALTDITQTHGVWHAYLNGAGTIPTIPTVINPSKTPTPGNTVALENPRFPAPVIPNIYIHKQSFDSAGKDTSHGGAGITILKAVGSDERERYLPNHIGEFLQPFIMPASESDGTAFVRDARVFLVGGEPIAGIIRRAREPLMPNNLTGEVVPELSQIYTARDRGPKESLTEPLRSTVFAYAKAVGEILKNRIGTFTRSYSQHSPVGFLSVDFLLDANHTPRPVDCDIQPMVDPFEGTNLTVAKELAKYAVVLAEHTGKQKQIMVIGFPDEEFTKAVYDALSQRVGSRAILQESLLSQVFRQLNIKR